MDVIADVFFAVAAVAGTAGAISEFKFRIGYICLSTDRAAVGIRTFYCSSTGFIGGSAGEGDNLWGLFLLFLAEKSCGIGAPGQREDIDHILAEEEEIVGKGNDGEQIIGEAIYHHTVKHKSQIDHSKDPGFHRDDIKQQKSCIRIQGGIT